MKAILIRHGKVDYHWKIPKTDWVQEDEKEYKSTKVHKNNSQGTFVLLHWLLENDTISIVSGVSFSICLAGSLLAQGAGFYLFVVSVSLL